MPTIGVTEKHGYERLISIFLLSSNLASIGSESASQKLLVWYIFVALRLIQYHKLMKYPALSIFFAFLIWQQTNFVVTAQTPTTALIDSLLQVLSHAAEDTNKVLMLSKVSYEYSAISTDEGLRFANEALVLAEQLKWEKGIAAAKGQIGRNHWRKGNFEEALKYHFEALALWEKLENAEKIAFVNIFIGQDYADAGNYFEALIYLTLALEGYKKLDLKHNQGVIHGIIAWVYQSMGLYTEALEHDYLSLKIYEEIGDKGGYAVVSSNLTGFLTEQGKYQEAIEIFLSSIEAYVEGEDYINESGAYIHIGHCYLKMKNYPEATRYLRIGLEKGKKINNPTRIAMAYAGIGDVQLAQKYFSKALENYLLAEEFYGQVTNRPALIGTYSKIGGCYVKLKRYKEAQQYFDLALSMNMEMNSTSEMNYYYSEIVKLDSATGRWKNAFENYKLYVATRDSLYNDENTKKMVQTRMQYEFDKKDAAAEAEREKKDALAQAELQKQKLIRNSFMGGFALVVFFSLAVMRQRNKVKKEKKRSDELLLNILPAEVADELKAKGSADAKLIDEVTVLFSDFKDFTQLSETQTPKELVAEINECFSAFDMIMQKHGVEKIKTVGDAYLAAGGLPTPNETHAINVLNAAIEMQEFIKERKRQREKSGGFFFEARIGVHTGPVVAGIVGIKKFAYDIWGDTVNTAQRMESNGEAGKINISQSTYRLAKNHFNCNYRGKIDTKGKGEVDMYFVESEIGSELFSPLLNS